LNVAEFAVLQLVKHPIEPLKLISVFSLADVLHWRVDNEKLRERCFELNGQTVNGDCEATFEKSFLSTAAQIAECRHCKVI